MADEAKVEAPVETPAEAPAVETPAAPPEDKSSEFEAIMKFDPFGPAEPAAADQDKTGTKVDGEEPSGKEPKVTTQDPKQPPKADATQPTEPPKQQGPTQKEQELAAQVAHLTKLIQQTQQQPQQQPTTTAEKPAERYNLGLPPQIIQGLRSDNDEEFAVAMHGVVNGIANKLWNDFQEHIAKEVTPQIDQRVLAIQQHGDTTKRIHDEFYGEHPHLKNPVVMPMVQRAAAIVAQQWQMMGKPVTWNKEFSDAVAATVSQVVPPPQQQQPTPPQPKPPQFHTQPGARPAAPASNEFASVL